MSYCDEACQFEHWTHVHRYNCPYLSGKKLVEDHNEQSCQNCIEKKTSEREELLSIKSPKIGCKVQEESKQMRKDLARMFGFHEIGRNHICSVEFGCHPIPMGKIPDKLVCTGLDEMMIHAAKLSNALIVKTMNDKVTPKETIGQLFELHKRIRTSRVIIWRVIVVFGNTSMAEHFINENFGDFMESLDKIFASDNVWWRALAFTIGVIGLAAQSQNWARQDTAGLTNPKLLELHDYHTNQVANISSVSQNKKWDLFKLWPTLVNQSLQLVLPQDTSCVTCKADLSGQTAVPDNASCRRLDRDSMTNIHPHSVLFHHISKEGGLVVTCLAAKKIKCFRDHLDNSTDTDEMSDEARNEMKETDMKARSCHLCRKRSLCSHRCKRCLTVQYCSKECATKDFAFHKTVCSTWSKDPNRKLMSANKQKEVFSSCFAKEK